ncbi:WD repeat-containing protein 59 [Mytilus galloprovincialis]|uniref:WD repeat-containing protein 59 n=1 Tax=Mytilus galloprovincialis TaxID=29158 RepID=A0A8B6E7M4_MYTGA|nr:WD repeat-containing protein 59 [Mytilus galloprovincialis]
MSQWSGEQSVAEYGDLQASAMAVDCTGQFAVLAGRKVMTLVDLDNPTDRVTKLTRQSKFDISCVQWHPYPVCGDLFATACNQRLDLFSWTSYGNINQKCSMRGHSRTVSDLDWSPFDVNIIASCSVDSYTHLWDIRDPKKPSNSFQTVAGASQVKWNKVTNNLFATTHEGDVRLWDPRKGSSPLQYIAAHLSKIHGLDWSPDSETNFATSSQDGTVKFWDTSNPRQSKGVITSGSPVWRARYTPFGHGLITAVVPQLRRGENSLYLWNLENYVAPVHQFVGHQDVILEFEWRKQAEGLKDYHLVTWSKDQSLRIWKIDQHLQKLCGQDVGEISDSSESDSTSLPYETNGSSPPTNQEMDFQRQMSASPEVYPGQKPRTLEQEFLMVNVAIDNVRVDELDVSTRTCKVTGMIGNNSLKLVISFPNHYPIHGVPFFEFTDILVDNNVMLRLLKVLKDTANRHARRNCLEPLLRQFSTTLDSLSFQTEERITPDTENLPAFSPFYLPYSRGDLPFVKFGSRLDSHIPFPRTSGARFCSAGYLVTFGRSKEAQKGSDYTPKAMSDLNSLVQKNKMRPHQTVPFNFAAYSRSPPTAQPDITIATYYYKSGPKKNRASGKRYSADVREAETKKPNIAPVKIYDSSRLLALHKILGEHYIINQSDISTMCKHNTSVAATVGRKDLVQLWSLVALTADKRLQSSDDPDEGPPWGRHPFGRNLMQSLMEYYIKLRDVQTLAMLCCVFWNGQELMAPPPPKPQQSISVEYSTPPNYNPYHTVSSMSNLVKGLQTLPVANKLADIVSLLSPPLSEVSSHPNLPELIQPTNQGVMKLKRSNSYSGFEIDTIDNDFKLEDEEDVKERQEQLDKTAHENYCRMLDPVDKNKYDEYLRCYANILDCWGLKNQSREVMKFVSNAPPEHRGIEFSVYCYKCSQPVRGSQCLSCKYPAFNCAICHLGVKGLSNFCLACGHGGHTAHLTEWFKRENECPTGCGCQCLKAKIHISLQ